MLLAGPSPARWGSLLAERDSPAAGIFAAITSGILPHAARAPSSRAGTAPCCKTGDGEEKRAFPRYRERCHRLPPPHQPAALLPPQTFLNIPMEEALSLVFWVFFFVFLLLLFFSHFYFFPLSNCTVARSFQASRSGAAFLCLIGNMCRRPAWRRRAWRGAGLPAWSTATAAQPRPCLRGATEPMGRPPLGDLGRLLQGVVGGDVANRRLRLAPADRNPPQEPFCPRGVPAHGGSCPWGFPERSSDAATNVSRRKGLMLPSAPRWSLDSDALRLPVDRFC